MTQFLTYPRADGGNHASQAAENTQISRGTNTAAQHFSPEICVGSDFRTVRTESPASGEWQYPAIRCVREQDANMLPGGKKFACVARWYTSWSGFHEGTHASPREAIIGRFIRALLCYLEQDFSQI